MRRFAFVIAIVGLFLLALLLNQKPKEVSDYEGLRNFEINSKVIVEGRVVSEKLIYDGNKILTLDNGLELICECSENFKGKIVEVVGIVEEYNDKKQIRVLRLLG